MKGSVAWVLTEVPAKTNNFIEFLDIADLNYEGCFYTWRINQDGASLIISKLDGVMVNEAGLSSFPDSKVVFLPPIALITSLAWLVLKGFLGTPVPHQTDKIFSF